MVTQPRRGRPRKTTAEIVTPVFVKVARTGGAVEEVCLNGELSVNAALAAANIDLENEDRVRVNGAPVNGDEVLANGDIITVAGRMAGA